MLGCGVKDMVSWRATSRFLVESQRRDAFVSTSGCWSSSSRFGTASWAIITSSSKNLIVLVTVIFAEGAREYLECVDFLVVEKGKSRRVSLADDGFRSYGPICNLTMNCCSSLTAMKYVVFC